MERVYFEAIEAMFSELMEVVKTDFAPSEICEVQDYIDVGEYGLALDTCVAIYFDEQKVMSEVVKDLLTRLAEKMSKNIEAVFAKFNV